MNISSIFAKEEHPNATFTAQQKRSGVDRMNVAWDVKRETLRASGLVDERASQRGPLALEDHSAYRDPSLLLPGSSVEHQLLPETDPICAAGEKEDYTPTAQAERQRAKRNGVARLQAVG